ncbi:MAG: hypothetical protein KC502_05630 [Myxococcales bacterium]|nr:hypothetical protein [Myxococcales bacterium]
MLPYVALAITLLGGVAAIATTRPDKSRAAADSGAVADGSTTVRLRRCCKVAAKGRLIVKPGEVGISALPDGRALPAGHPDDVYYTGRKPSTTRLPAAYRFWPIVQPLKINFRADFPASVRFHGFATHGRNLTQAAETKMVALLKRVLGDGARLSRLGQGGHQVVWRACRVTLPGAKQTRCVVAKVRRMGGGRTAKERRAVAVQAAAGLRRDLALFRVAEEVTARAHFVGEKGRAKPTILLGRAVRGSQPPAGPAGRIARTARLLHPAALTNGVVVQELIAFRPSAQLRKMLAGLEGPNGVLRDKAWTEAPKFGVNRVRVLGFIDRYKSVSRIGPDVIRLSAFVRDCAAVKKVPTIGAFCVQVRRDFRVPDDFLSRVRALEQLFRDSAGAVMRFHRANFDVAVGNPGVDGKVREVGLDYNHGRNVGWDPTTLQFVLFDL